MKYGNFTFEKSEIDGVIVITPKIFKDHRGYFLENYSKRDFMNGGVNTEFVQMNQSKSTKGTLRGLHYQYKHPQGKLVTVIKGEVFDVAVDIRKDSSTYGKYVSVFLSEDNKKSIYIPPYFAHGFLVTSEEATFTYQTTDYYYPEYDAGVRFDDPDINIIWPKVKELILSDKDKKLPYLKERKV